MGVAAATAVRLPLLELPRQRRRGSDGGASEAIGTRYLSATMPGCCDSPQNRIGTNAALQDEASNTGVCLARQQGNPEMVTLLGGG